MNKRTVSDELVEALDDLGLRDRIVEVHASMRSFSPRVDAADVLAAFAKASVTALLPAFSDVFEVRPTTDVQMEANGYVYGDPAPCGSAPQYHQMHADVNAEMGALPRVAVEHGAVRGNHPFNGFCATGPKAADIIATQTPEDTYGPVAAVVERRGKLLLIGVDLRRATCLHHAETLAGRRQFTRWYCDGAVMRPARTGGCSAAFDAFTPFVTPPRQRVVFGSTWSVYDIATLVEEVRSAVAADLLLGLCSADGCHRCLSARARIS